MEIRSRHQPSSEAPSQVGAVCGDGGRSSPYLEGSIFPTRARLFQASHPSLRWVTVS